MLGLWTVTSEATGDACAVAWLDLATQRVVVTSEADCGAANPSVEAASCEAIVDALRIEVNAQCHSLADAFNAARNIAESIDETWTVTTGSAEACALAWADEATHNITISDIPPSR